MEVAAASSSTSQAAAKKEWRAVSEHTFRTNGAEDAEHGKLGQSDERTIYEEGMRPLDVDYCSITINDGGEVSGDALQQRLQGVARQREALQQMEIELRAQAIARSEILEVRNNLEAQLKEHSIATSKLKEQLDERERHMLDLRMKLEDKDRELHALKIDSETAWAKEDLLREQNKELATFRRERDNAEAERAQHLKQIHELQEHIREKESQFLSLEEQHRVAHETILFKDEQLREAQAWISRVQEMDVLQSPRVQAELRERTEQFTQYWMALQRQYVIMERHHMQTIQQLQFELNEAKKTNGIHKDSGQVMNENSSDSSYVQNNGNHINVNDPVKSHGSLAFTSNGSVDVTSLYASVSNQSAKTDHVHGVPSSSVIGMGTFLPSQMTALHPYVMNPQGIQQSFDANSPIPQSLVGHFQSLPTNPGHNQWQAHQITSEVSQVNQSTFQSSQSEQDLLKADPHYGFGLSSETQMVQQHLSSHGSQQPRSSSAVNGLSEEVQVFESIGMKHSGCNEQQGMLTVSSLHSALEFNPAEQKSELEGDNILASRNQSHEQVLTSGQQWSTPNVTISSSRNQIVNSTGVEECNVNDVKSPEASVTTAQVPKSLVAGKSLDPNLLDQRSLLACIVRAIPAGPDRKIRISTTLSNRLAKMLAPLHWHDYKKHFGKLDDFVAHHPELFVIEGDFIHLREGAQEIISATTAAAKVAAAASSAPYSSLLPSVAVTPVAQINRQKKPQLMVSRAANSVSLTDGVSVTSSRNSSDIPQISKRQDQQQQNGVSFNIIQGVADVAISNKQKTNQDIDVLPSVTRPVNLSTHLTVGETTILNGTGLSSSRINELSNGRHYFGGKQQARCF